MVSKAPRPYRPACQVLGWLLVLFSATGCQRLSAGRSTQLVVPKASALRVSGLANQPANLLVWKVELEANDYCAPPFTSLSYTDPYVIERGGGEGGIRLMSEGGRPVKEFVIPRREIIAIVRLRYDMDVVDWTDVVIGKNKVTLIHTGFANAGVFTPSEVYVFPRSRNTFDYLKVIETNAWAADDLKLLYPALLFYETGNRAAHRFSNAPQASKASESPLDAQEVQAEVH